ncbi:hypothetical protein ACO03V_07310 [Microbacterium sp. HMH0099]|uniref:hypothetical protein n=1 Tax=Microbacterium sp. HMH0099 TaxID=3414026 RepID=UPI003BF688FA
MSPTSPRPRAAAPVLAAVLALVLGGIPSSADAAWRASVPTPTAALSAGRLTAPAIGCETRADGLLGVSYAYVSWLAVDHATSYDVLVGSTSGAARERIGTTTGTAFEVRGGLLTLLLGTLLSTGTPIVSVVARTGEWRSPESDTRTIGLTGVVGTVVGSVRCV